MAWATVHSKAIDAGVIRVPVIVLDVERYIVEEMKGPVFVKGRVHRKVLDRGLEIRISLVRESAKQSWRVMDFGAAKDAKISWRGGAVGVVHWVAESTMDMFE